MYENQAGTEGVVQQLDVPGVIDLEEFDKIIDRAIKLDVELNEEKKIEGSNYAEYIVGLTNFGQQLKPEDYQLGSESREVAYRKVLDSNRRKATEAGQLRTFEPWKNHPHRLIDLYTVAPIESPPARFRVREGLLKLKMAVAGIKNPESLLATMKKYCCVDAFVPAMSEDGRELVGIQFQSFEKKFFRELAKLDKPVIAVERLAALGIEITTNTQLFKLPQEFITIVNRLCAVNEEQFKKVSDRLQPLWIFKSTPALVYGEGSSITICPEAAQRIAFVFTDGPDNHLLTAAHNMQDSIEAGQQYNRQKMDLTGRANLEYISLDERADYWSNIVEIQKYEFAYFPNDEEIHNQYFSEELAQHVVDLISAGYTFENTDRATPCFLYYLRSNYDSEIHQVAEIVSKAHAHLGNEAYQSMRTYLGTWRVVDDQLIGDLINIQVDLKKQLDLITDPAKQLKELTIIINTLADPWNVTAIDGISISTRAAIRDILSRIKRRFGADSRQSKQLSEMIIRSLILNKSGVVDQELVDHWMFNPMVAKHISSEELASIPEEKARVIRLVGKIDLIKAPNLLHFLKAKYETGQIAVLLTDSGTINLQFCDEFFSLFHGAQYLGQEEASGFRTIMDESGLAPEFMDYCEKINAVQNVGQKGIPDPKELFHLYLSLNCDSSSLELVKYWQQKDTEVFVRLLTKESFSKLVGTKDAEAFLTALPRETYERRNAFLHNPYDRTSQWLLYMMQPNLHKYGEHKIPQEGYFVFDTDIVIAADFINLYGLSTNILLFSIFKQLHLRQAGKPYNNALLEEFGISSFEELKKQESGVEKILSEQDSFADVEKLTVFQQALISQLAKVDSHQFFGKKPIGTIIENFIACKQRGEIHAIDSAYKPLILETSEVKVGYSPSREALDLYQKISTYAREAMDQSGNREYWTSLRDELMKLYVEKLDRITISLNSIDESKKSFLNLELANTSKQIEQLAALQEDWQLLVFLSSTKVDKQQLPDIQNLILRLILWKYALHVVERGSQVNFGAITQLELDVRALLSAKNIFSDLIKQHLIAFQEEDALSYWGKDCVDFFTDSEHKQPRSRVQSIVNDISQSFEQEVKKIETTDLASRQTVEFIPDNGLVGELSAFIGEACYSAEFPLLNRDNMVAYKIISQFGAERAVIGSVLVFTVETERGPALLMRALNIPTEERFNISDVIEKFLDYLASTGKSINRGMVIVPGDSGAISNRTQTINHIKSKYCVAENRINLTETFNFNNHNITNNCYIARMEN